MLGLVSKLVSERGRAPEDETAPDEGSERPSVCLYECPDCESVYLSEDLATCRSCNTSVEPVPSERDLGYGSTRSR